MTRYKKIDFESLDYNLYKLVNNDLKVVSKSGKDLFSQKDGLYFLPPPGYNINRYYEKQRILQLVDSISHLTKHPLKVKLKTLEY